MALSVCPARYPSAIAIYHGTKGKGKAPFRDGHRREEADDDSIVSRCELPRRDD